MLFKRKFLDDQDDEFTASPHIASVQIRLLEALAAVDRGSWTAWADVAGHPSALDRFVAHVAQSDWWGQATPVQRRQYALNYLAPLWVPNQLLDSLVENGQP